MKKLALFSMIMIVAVLCSASVNAGVLYRWYAVGSSTVEFEHIGEGYFPSIEMRLVDSTAKVEPEALGVCGRTKVCILKSGSSDTLFCGFFNPTAEAVLSGKKASLHICTARTMEGTTFEWISEIHAVVEEKTTRK